MTIQLGDAAPDFTAETTEGRLSLHEYLGDSWGLLFSHPADFTPVCTTELGEFARRKDDFTQRDVKLIGVSVDPVDSHRRWSNDIAETQGTGLNYPLVGDGDHSVANLYGMIRPNAIETATVRTVFVIDPDKEVKLTLTYPANVGRNVEEILRVIDALQLGGAHAVSTPVNWHDGDEVIISPCPVRRRGEGALPEGLPDLEAIPTPHPTAQQVSGCINITCV